MHWCQQELSQLDVTTPPTARDFLSRRRGITPNWYISFLYRTRAHVAAGSYPILQHAPSLDEEKTGGLTATRDRMKALQEVGYGGVEQAR
jgi:hypothetical protein